MTAARAMALFVAVVGGVLLVAALLWELHELRTVLAAAFCLLVPGAGWARRMRLNDRGDTLALTVVLSLCLTIGVATAMAVSGWWSWIAGIATLAVIAVAGFVPARQVVTRIVGALPERLTTAPAGSTDWADWYREMQELAEESRRGRAADAKAAESSWIDWFSDARRRADEERARRARAADAASAEWIEWYAAHADEDRTSDEDRKDESARR